MLTLRFAFQVERRIPIRTYRQPLLTNTFSYLYTVIERVDWIIFEVERFFSELLESPRSWVISLRRHSEDHGCP